jgi:adenylate cyclase
MIALAQLGFFQAKEIGAFDRMTQLAAQHRSSSRASDRIVIVGITEQDIQAQKQWPLSDQVFAQVLLELQTHSPAMIGLDIYSQTAPTRKCRHHHQAR